MDDVAEDTHSQTPSQEQLGAPARPSPRALRLFRLLSPPLGVSASGDEFTFLTGPLRWWLPLGTGLFVAEYVAVLLWAGGQPGGSVGVLVLTACGALVLHYATTARWHAVGYVLGLAGITLAVRTDPMAALGYAGWTAVGSVVFPTWGAFFGLGILGAGGYIGARAIAGALNGQEAATTLAVAWAIGVVHLGALLLVREIKARAHLAMTDPLTGIANRRLLLWRLAEELAEVERSGGTLTLLYLDLDKFKRINDALGHHAGDRVLQQVARILRQAVRPHDVVARVGGDEFVVLAPGLGEDGAEGLAERLQQAVAEARLPLLRGLTAGWVVAPRDGRTVEALLELADASLFSHRRRSRYDGSSLARDLEIALRLLPEGVRHLIRFLDAEDVELEVHLARVGHWSLELGRRVGLDLASQRALAQAALVHDIGKIALPHALLRKPGPLSPEEQAQVAQHVALGVTLLRALGVDEAVVSIVASHHERWDGRGYPRGVAGEAIPLGARILTLADGYDALVSDRSLPPKEAEVELGREAGRQFDPRLVEAFLSLRSTSPASSEAQSSGGSATSRRARAGGRSPAPQPGEPSVQILPR